MQVDLIRRAVAEAVGSALLVATVVGSGIMAARLSGGNAALALLANTISTGAILVVLITILGPVSGAHFNPAVSLVMAWRGELGRQELRTYIIAQVIGACVGTWVAHLMFDLPVLQLSITPRTGIGQWIAELVAAFGLIFVILGTSESRPGSVPMSVGLYITAAYWFTASTSFANPAVTIARSLTNTFSGIMPWHVPAFILAQIAGAFLGTALVSWLMPPRE